MRTNLRELILYGLLGALLFGVQVALAALPNIELVSTLIIVYTLVLGLKALYPVCVFVTAEILLYGLGLWTVDYLYIWAILVFAVHFLNRFHPHKYLWAAVSAAYGLFFGALCALPTLLIAGPVAAFAYWISGLPFDFLHFAGNAVLSLLLISPLCALLRQGIAAMQKSS